MSAPIRQLSLWQAPKFLVNSRLGLFSATTQGSGSESLHLTWLPLSRSYGYILPSSLTRVLPRTLGFSPRIPVSVYGTGGSSLTRSFSRQCRLNPFSLHRWWLRITPRAYRVRICLYPTPHACTRTSIPVRACLPVSLPRSNNRCRFRNLNRMSISDASCLGLGPDLPWDDDRCPGILMLSVGRILTALFATHANILTSCQSTVPYSTASARQERSSTTQPLRLHP